MPDYNHNFIYGRWNDMAVTVATNKVTIYSCTNASDVKGAITNKTLVTTSMTKTDAAADLAIGPGGWQIRIGGESSGVVSFTNGLNNVNKNEVKAFRGDIHSMAFWTRTLTADEVQRVISERRPTVVQMGLANGNSDEFAKSESTTDGTGFHPERWNPVLNAENPTRTVTFTVVDGEQDVSQYVRLRPIASSAPATIRFSLDGKALVTQTISPDADALVYLKAALMTRGEHTLTLTRTDSNGGDFTVDALCVHGSWRIGDSSDEWGGMVHESTYPYQYKNRIFPLTDGNVKHFARGLSGGASGDNGKHTVPFDIPADLLDKMRDATLTLSFGATGANPAEQCTVSVNGTVLTNSLPMAFSTSAKVIVPVGVLKAGANTVVIQKNGSNWTNLKCYSLSLGQLISGCLLIVR